MIGLKLMLTAIIKPSYSLCLILFDIDLLFLVSSHINVEQFLGLMLGGYLQNSVIRKNKALEKVDLGQKTGMLNYRTSMSKHFEGLHRQCTFCLLGLALSLNSVWNQEIWNNLKYQKKAIQRNSELHSWSCCKLAVGESVLAAGKVPGDAFEGDMLDPRIYTSVGQLLRQHAPGDCCKGLTLPTLLCHASYLLFRQDKKLKLINRKQCWYAIHAVYFFTDREWQEKMGWWGVRVRVVNGKADEIRICFSQNCFNPSSYNKHSNWEET